MRITEQRAISSKESADGIGVVNAMAEGRGWWGLRSGAKDVRNCFQNMKLFELFCRWARGLHVGVFQAHEEFERDQNLQEHCSSLATVVNQRRANMLSLTIP
jgi:hypothetical protein